jgi:hypothetical protein
MQHVPEMPFAKDHDVVEAFPPDQADETFAISILPGGPRGCWSVPNAHRPQSTFEDLAIGTVPVTDARIKSALDTATINVRRERPRPALRRPRAIKAKPTT